LLQGGQHPIDLSVADPAEVANPLLELRDDGIAVTRLLGENRQRHVFQRHRGVVDGSRTARPGLEAVNFHGRA
jgi:hypothetical protein